MRLLTAILWGLLTFILVYNAIRAIQIKRLWDKKFEYVKQLHTEYKKRLKTRKKK